MAGFHRLQITEALFKAPKTVFHHFRAPGFVTTSTNLKNLWLKHVCIMWSQIPRSEIPNTAKLNTGSPNPKLWCLFSQELLSIRVAQPEWSYHLSVFSQGLTGSSHWGLQSLLEDAGPAECSIHHLYAINRDHTHTSFKRPTGFRQAVETGQLAQPLLLRASILS